MQITSARGVHIIIDEASCNMRFEAALLRHPPVLAAPGTCYGRLDLPLAAGWRECVLSASARLAPVRPCRIWSSPTSRCALAAELLSRRLGVPLTLDARLRELDFGAWEGLPWDAVPRASLDRWAADPPAFRAPRGESGAALIRRVAAFARVLREEARSCVVVSHAGPLRLLPRLLCREPPELLAASPAPGSLRVVQVS